MSAAKAKEPKVVLIRPKRHVRERAGKLAEPVYVGGRVLRNGKRTRATRGEDKATIKKMEGRKRGRPRKKVQYEVDGDEIVDDDLTRQE